MRFTSIFMSTQLINQINANYISYFALKDIGRQPLEKRIGRQRKFIFYDLLTQNSSLRNDCIIISFNIQAKYVKT